MLSILKTGFVSSLAIRKKLFILRMGIGLCMGLFIGLSCFFIATRIFFKVVENDLNNSAELTMSLIQQDIANSGNALVQIAKSNEMELYYHSSRDSILTTLFARHKDIFGKIAYIDDKGTIDLSSVGLKINRDVGQTDTSEGFSQAIKNPNTLIVGEIVFDNDLKTFVHQLYYQHIDYFDNNLGTIRASLTLERFAQDLYALLSKNKAQSFVVTDRNNRILYCPDNKHLGLDVENILPNVMVDKGTPFEKKYIGRVAVQDASFLVTVHALSDPKWNVFVLKPIKAIVSPLFILFGLILFATLGAILLAEIASKKLGLKITEPITKLQQVTSTILKNGDLAQRVEWSSKDELGKLSESFNSMLEKLSVAQKKLNKERQFIEYIMNSMTELLIVVSPEWQIMKINSKVVTLLGFSEEQLMQQPLTKIGQGFASRLNSDLFDGTGEHAQYISHLDLTTKAGNDLSASFNVVELIGPEGRKIGYLIIGKDIRRELKTSKEKQLADEKLKAAQEDLLKTEKLAIVGQMSGMVAHEVLNPISAIYTRLDLNIREQKKVDQVNKMLLKLVGDWQQELNAGNLDKYMKERGQKDIQLLHKIAESIVTKGGEQADNLDFINKLIHRVIRIIDNLREMSRHEKNPEKFHLCKLLNEVVEDMSDGLNKRGIYVDKKYNTDPELYADYMEIYSIFSNSLKNAKQAIEANNNQRKKTVTIELWQEGDLACIQFSDTGIGISSDAEHLLFKTGFSSKGREGTGLGLSYSRKIARETGGDIVLTSSIPGEGSSFLITLNTAKEKQ